VTKCLTELLTWMDSLDKRPKVRKMYKTFCTWNIRSLYGAGSLIRVDLREIGWGGMDWTNLAQDRDQWRALVNMLLNLRVP
jgi:hypothetical protein